MDHDSPWLAIGIPIWILKKIDIPIIPIFFY